MDAVTVAVHELVPNTEMVPQLVSEKPDPPFCCTTQLENEQPFAPAHATPDQLRDI